MAEITILNDQKVPEGPFTREQVAAKLQAGTYSLESWAFIEGLTQWTPLRDVLARVDASLAPPAMPSVPPPARPAPARPAPARPAPAYASAPALAPSSYSYAATMAPPTHLVYAGFWLRFVAIFIDVLILLPLTLISFGIQWGLRQADDSAAQMGLTAFNLAFAAVAFFIRWLYFALLESSGMQATLGKKIMGILVTGPDGGRIGFGRASGRYFGKILSALFFCIGFMMAGFTERKQALHDMVAGTFVVRR